MLKCLIQVLTDLPMVREGLYQEGPMSATPVHPHSKLVEQRRQRQDIDAQGTRD